MEVEIKNFYLRERKQEDQLVKGSLHVVIKVSGIELNIRGILVSKQKGRWFFRTPFKTGVCTETGTSVIYPIVTFTDPALNKALIEALQERVPAFIGAFLTANPQLGPLITQPAAQCFQTKPLSAQAPHSKPQALGVLKKSLFREFQDPPPRSPKLRSRQR